MSKSEKDIKKEIRQHIKDNGDQPSHWYVGITNDARRRLFNANEHNVSENRGTWIYRTANTVAVARRVEKYFIDTVGTDGGAGGGTDDTTRVYAYKKTRNTTP